MEVEDWMELRQVLTQLNFHMRKKNVRYGYVRADKELVAVRRLDTSGNLELSDPVPWSSGLDDTTGRLTVLLGLWHLGMLASKDDD